MSSQANQIFKGSKAFYPSLHRELSQILHDEILYGELFKRLIIKQKYVGIQDHFHVKLLHKRT